jgi:hypothetical protein
VKTSFWNFLTFILSMAGVLMAGLFFYIFNNPFSRLNPYPPPTLVSTAAIPTLTASPQSLPNLWTGTPEPELVPASADLAASSPETVETIEIEATITPVILMTTETQTNEAKSAPLPTEFSDTKEVPAQALAPQEEITENPSEIKISAPVGVFSNTWQKLQAIPSFSWKVPDIFMDIKNYKVYFSSRMDEKPVAITTIPHYSHPAVKSGEYFLRVDAIGNNGQVLETSPYFVFRYDDTPPTEPAGFGTSDPPNTITPYFTWQPSRDEHSGMSGGLSGYAIYQGISEKCGKPVAFTSVAYWNPVNPLVGGTPEYFCIKALDAVGNESNWVGPIAFTFTP